MTAQYDESLWPPAALLRDTALLLVGLVLVVLLADGQLVVWLSLPLIIAWGVLGGGVHADPDRPLWPVLLPLFIAITVAQLLAPSEWFVVAVIAIGTPLAMLTRAGLVLRERRAA